MRKKQQTTEHEDSHDHIILHHKPAALLRAEKNFIHLDAGLSLLGTFLGLFVQCLVVYVHFILFIKLFLCSISFKCIYAEQHSRCESLNERLSRLSYCMMKSLMFCIK